MRTLPSIVFLKTDFLARYLLSLMFFYLLQNEYPQRIFLFFQIKNVKRGEYNRNAWKSATTRVLKFQNVLDFQFGKALSRISSHFLLGIFLYFCKFQKLVKKIVLKNNLRRHCFAGPCCWYDRTDVSMGDDVRE